MKKWMKNRILTAQAVATSALMVGMNDANAQVIGAGSKDFSDIAENITRSIEQLPGLLSGLAYLIGLLLGVLGILKIRDHVENPSQSPLKEGAVRIAAGGSLFALPIIFEAMTTTIGETSNVVEPSTLNRVDFNVR